MKSNSKSFFILSFIPAIAYWYLEANYPIRIAVGAGVFLAVIEVVLEIFIYKRVHTISKLNFFLITFLGGLSLIGDEGVWFRLQPCFTGIGIGSFLLYRISKGNGIMLEMMHEMNPQSTPPHYVVKTMEIHIGAFFLLYGTFMGFVSFLGTTNQWIFFKTLGFYAIFAVFSLFEVIWIRRKVKISHVNQQKMEILSRF